MPSTASIESLVLAVARFEAAGDYLAALEIERAAYEGALTETDGRPAHPISRAWIEHRQNDRRSAADGQLAATTSRTNEQGRWEKIERPPGDSTRSTADRAASFLDSWTAAMLTAVDFLSIGALQDAHDRTRARGIQPNYTIDDTDVERVVQQWSERAPKFSADEERQRIDQLLRDRFLQFTGDIQIVGINLETLNDAREIAVAMIHCLTPLGTTALINGLATGQPTDPDLQALFHSI